MERTKVEKELKRDGKQKRTLMETLDISRLEKRLTA
jgi:hypothetical protein